MFPLSFSFLSQLKIFNLIDKGNLFFEHVCQKFSLSVLLSFCLVFCQFQPGVAYESVASKKKRVLVTLNGHFIYEYFY